MRAIQFMIGSYGGAERFFVRLSAALEARGLKQLLIVNDDDELVAAVQASNLNYKILSLSRFGALVDRRIVARYAKSFSPDIFVSWMNRAGRRQPKGAHVNIGRLGGYYPVKNYKTCDYLIANTPDIAASCRAQGWPSDRVQEISNFTDDFARPPNAAPPSIEGPLRICALGRFDAWKGFDTLIDALSLTENATLELAGQGPQEAELRSQVSRLGLHDRVTFLGWMDNRARLFAGAQICVVPSRHEPLGNVILEAWSAGCPVIAAASEGPRWLIDDGQTGLLFEPGNAIALRAALETARKDPVSREKWAVAGRERWAREFSIDSICRQYLNFFEMITGGSSGSGGAKAMD